jgi:hypothetical protein
MSQRARARRLFVGAGFCALAVAVLFLAVAFSGPGTAVAAPAAADPVTVITLTWPSGATPVYVKVGGTFTTSYSTDGLSDPLNGSVKYQLGLNAVWGPFSTTLPVNTFVGTLVVPAGLADGVYDFKVLAANLGQTNWAEQSAISSVIIDSTAPKVPTTTLISPNGGEYWAIGSCHDIVWNAAGIVEQNPLLIDLELWIGGVKVGNIATNLPNTSPFNWCLDPALVSITNQAKVKLIARDPAGNSASDTSDNNFTIYGVDKTPPVCTWVTPLAGNVKGTLPVQANAADAESGIKQVLFQISTNLGSTWGALGTDTTGPSPYETSLNTATYADGSKLWLRATCTNGADVPVTTDPVQVIVDNSGPTTAMNQVPACLSGTVGVGATASDAHSGISQVLFQNSLNGIAWSDIISDTVAPYSASFDTTTVPDGAIWFRDIATNGVALTATSAPVQSRVDNTVPLVPAITMPISGTVWQIGTTVQIKWDTATVSDTGKLATNPVSLELVCVGDPQTLATGLPNSGSWNWTIANVLPDTECYIRIIVTDECGNTNDNYTGDFPAEVVVGANFLSGGPFMVFGQDSTPPVVAISAPAVGAWLRGPVAVAATASDAQSGIAQVEFFMNIGAGDVSCGVDTGSPYAATCTPPAGYTGPVTFKAVATNGVGATATASVAANWDNTPPIATLAVPAPPTTMASGIAFHLAATASDVGSGVAKVEFYFGPCGAGTLIGSDAAAPYETNWNTTTAPDGPTSVWAMAYDVAGNTGLSVCYSVQVLNTFTQQLFPGWNLISTPLVPYNTAISAAFAGLPVKQVVTFVWSGGILTQKTYVPGVGGTLTTFLDGQGYWVEMNAAATFSVKGAVLGVPPSPLPAYAVNGGWNLIGYTARMSTPTRLVQEYLGPDNWAHALSVYQWNPAGYYEVPGGMAMNSGRGYWLAMSQGGTIYP